MNVVLIKIILEYANNCLANKVLKQTKISILAIELILSLFKL